MNELYRLSAVELSALLREKQVSAEEIAKAHLDRIRAVEPKVDALLAVTEEKALADARKADAAIAAGEELGALTGIPMLAKDNVCTNGIRTTCGSRMLENFVPPYNAAVMDKLEAAGAVLLGKTNMDDFAMGTSCENSYFKPTKNPWDLTRVPGGSSGGSAAAVAACEAPIALGSDTGGSIRCPAGFCGVVGLKPTYGAVSRFGVVAFASSLDQVGTMGRTVADTELMFAAICGRDRKDATSKDYLYEAKPAGLKGLRIGLPKEYYTEGISAEVKEKVLAAVEQMKAQGAEVVEVSLPSTEYALAAYYIISSAEAASNLHRFDGVRYGYTGRRDAGVEEMFLTTRTEGFGEEVKRRIMLGTFALSSGANGAYNRAKRVRQVIGREFAAAFEKCDFIVAPVNPTTAFKLGEKVSDPVQMYASDVCTVPVNIAGLPALAVPCGQDSAGLPVGMQMIGPKFSEATLISAAKAYEASVGGFAVKEM